MKKIIALLMACLLSVGLSACAEQAPPVETSGAAPAQEKLRVVCTIFPQYDWVRELVGQADSAELTLLLDSGVDLHSYQPSAADLVKISSCDLFIYVGGESDEWVADALKQSVNPDMVVLNLMELLGDGVKPEEVVEGMQDEEHDHDADEHDHDHEDDDHDHEEEHDEHVWLSLKNASLFCRAISDALCGLDPEHADTYRENIDRYTQKLDALDKAYQSAVDSAGGHTLLFGDRFPFRYLTEDYGLSYYAAFVGCSAETEASFETVIFLAQKVDALKLPAVLALEGAQHKIAQTVVDNTAGRSAKVLTMDSMQSVTARDVAEGKTYLGIMEGNLDVLTEALG